MQWRGKLARSSQELQRSLPVHTYEALASLLTEAQRRGLEAVRQSLTPTLELPRGTQPQSLHAHASHAQREKPRTPHQ